MDFRCASVESEHLRILGPIKALFNGLESPPEFSMMDALADVILECKNGNIEMDASELDGIVISCDEFGTDRKDFGEATLLCQREVASIAIYTSEFIDHAKSFFSTMNSFLRGAQRRQLKPFVKFIWLLMHALKKCPVFEGKFVYRGVRKQLGGYAQGRKISWCQFASCFCDFEAQQKIIGKEGPRTIFKIEVRRHDFIILLNLMTYF